MQGIKTPAQCIINATYTDKKCRICGYADVNNVHIFDGPNQLWTKIITVFPIILYPNDPLPKNICRKCIYNVNAAYNDIQRFIRTQSKWINNVRMVRPNHPYIKVLDLIEHTKNVTKNSIQATIGEDIKAESINRFLLLDQLNHTNAPETDETVNTSPSSSQSKSKKPTQSTDFTGRLNNNIQSKVNCKNSKQKELPSTCHTVTTRSLTVGHHHQPETVCIKLEREVRPKGSPPPLTVKCRYCPLQFKTLKALAIHQPMHMTLSLPRMYERKYLAKSARRGRVIMMEEKKSIRCLNCWCIFADNKSIVQHWSCGDCNFYCHICGAEFAQTPKMLREHVPAVHGVTYRSSKRHYNLTHKMHDATANGAHVIYKKSANNKCGCEICGLNFQSIKARNSHMRVHNPSFMYGSVVVPLHTASDAYEKSEPEDVTVSIVKKERSDTPESFTNVLPGIATLPKNCTHMPNTEQNNETGCIKVKSITDLQNESTTTTNHYDMHTLSVTHIKDEPMDMDLYTIKHATFQN